MCLTRSSSEDSKAKLSKVISNIFEDISCDCTFSGGYPGWEPNINSKTLKTFTSCQFCNKNNRRGLIFDKPALENEEGGPACDCNPSSSSFGHSGFTGTLAWVDPSENFVYVFLSNRVHPTSENNKLLEMDVRTKIMDVFYKSIRQ